jgi:WhiB family redox-sensing transcriptional regulator
VTTKSRKACQDEDPELFFPISYTTASGLVQVEEAKAVCRRCPIEISEACLQRALDVEGNADVRRRNGIWGATTPAERRAIYDTRRKTTLAA